MKLGIGSGSYLAHYGIAEGAHRMRAHGYDCVDFQDFIATENPEFVLPESDFARILREKRAILEYEGITVSQSHGAWRYPARDATPEERTERFEAMSKAIRGSAYLGAPYMIIHPMMPFGENSPAQPERMREINRDYYSRLSEVGKEYGVVVCLENMPFPSLPITTAAQVADFVRELDTPWLRVCLDTGHALCLGQTPADAVRTIGGDLLATLHVHDNDGQRDLHLRPGQGIADWDAFSTALREIGFDGVFSLETGPDYRLSKEDYEAQERSLAAYAKKLAGKE